VADAGFDITIDEDGELAIAASPELRSTAFNRALGHRMLPQMTDRMRAFFGAAGTTGWIVADREPWAGAEGDQRAAVMAAEPAQVAAAATSEPPAGTTIREIDRDEADGWASVLVEASGIAGREAEAWRAATPRLAGSGGHHQFLVEERGEPIAVGGLFTRRRVGLLAMAAVLPRARGRGLQRALISHRARFAADRGCTLVIASAVTGGPSSANLSSCGFRAVQELALYRVDPSD
jgi:GNAT superfamily N-acetyltransferase